MLITRGFLLRSMLERMPSVKFYDMMFFVNAILELLVKRILEDRAIMIDGFGIISRTKSKPRRLFNVATRKYQVVTSNSVAFRPHRAFLKMVEWTGEDFLREVIRKKSIVKAAARKKGKRII